MANKKIVVLKLRELIYTGIFLFFGIILILLLVAMFSGGRSGKKSDKAGGNSGAAVSDDVGTDTGSDQENAAAETFNPGIYTADFTLAGNTYTLQLLADSNRIKSVNLISLQSRDSEDYITTMYPLIEPALQIIESNLADGIPLSEITFSVENQYTGSLLVDALEDLMEKAKAQ